MESGEMDYKLGKFKQVIVEEMVQALAQVSGVECIILGGSYARGAADDHSDIDLGLYYFENRYPNIEHIREIARDFTIFEPRIYDVYERGPWKNGGGALITEAGVIEWILMSIDQMHRVIGEARQGRFTKDHPFLSANYLAYPYYSTPLYDPRKTMVLLKQAVQEYPDPLRQALLRDLLQDARRSLHTGKKCAERDCVYGAIESLTSVVRDLTYILFALNRVYFPTQKGSIKMTESFLIKPREYGTRINRLLTHPGRGSALMKSWNQLETITEEVAVLAHSK